MVLELSFKAWIELSCQVLYVYFTTGMCKRAKYQIKVKGKLPSNERTNRRSMDSSWTQIRKTKETGWIKRLRIAFVYVLKDKIIIEDSLLKILNELIDFYF